MKICTTYLRRVVAADVDRVSVAIGGGDLVLFSMLGDERELWDKVGERPSHSRPWAR